ncbi:MAG: exosortase U, partial [Aureliella sp.]
TLMGNFLRIFGILSLQEYIHRDFSNGWDYRILEGTTAAIVLLLIWCSSRFLRRIFEPIPVADAEFGPVFSGLNKLFCWPQPDPFDDLEPEDDYEKQRFLKRRAERLEQQPKHAAFLWNNVPATLWTVRIVPVVLLLAAILPVRSLASQGLSSLNFGRPTLSLTQVEKLAGPEALPDTLEGKGQVEGESQTQWKKIGFQIAQRNPRSRQGEYSMRWGYRSTEGEFAATIDLPFLGWNDPIDELELRGWKAGPVDIRWQNDWPWGECELENELGGKETIYYALFTRSGEPYTRIPSRLLPEQVTETADVDTVAANQQSATAVTYQFQLLSESGGELSQAGREALRTQFLQLREAALALVKK